MSNIKAWVSAFRLRTLPLALSSIIMGSFIAAYYQAFKWPVFIMASVTTLFLQILSNLANDYGDTIHGADHQGREGPGRMVQTGLISLKQMRIAIAVFVVLSIMSGSFLIYVGFKDVVSYKSILFFVIGISAVFAAIKYTMGKNPYGYQGMGDIYVLLFFGFVGVGGAFYMHSNVFVWPVLLPALSVGLLSSGVLNVNNMRDQQSDLEAGKLTLVVRYGIKWAKKYHFIMVITSFISLFLFVIMHDISYYNFLFVIILPLFIRHLGVILNAKTVNDFDPELKRLALSTLLLVLIFGLGLMIQ